MRRRRAGGKAPDTDSGGELASGPFESWDLAIPQERRSFPAEVSQTENRFARKRPGLAKMLAF